VEVRLIINGTKGEPSLKKMPGSLVPAIETLRVRPVQMMHSAGEIAEVARDDEVEVIRHEAVSVETQFESVEGAVEERNPCVAISVVSRDRHAIDASRVRVEEPELCEVQARASRHSANRTFGSVS
jgi:hypothetical protein